jgi:hypothetical protein
MNTLSKLKSRIAKNVGKLTKEEAKEILIRKSKMEPSIFWEEGKKITGGFQSQSINGLVIRALAVKSGMIKK